ncbi:MAG: AAA family ATPase [Phycisphaerae bacterium]
MLIEFRFKNYRSFRDEQVLSLVASSDKEHQLSLFDTGRVKLLKAAAIYGPNASGKSNIAKALSFMQGMVLESGELEPSDRIRAEHFALDNGAGHEPSEFEVTFLLSGVRYQYGFSLTRERISSEWLMAFPKGRAQRWFERTLVSGESDWYFGPNLKGQNERLADFTRPNSLFLSVAVKLNHKQLAPVLNWFDDTLGLWLPEYPLERAISYTAHRSSKNRDFKARLVRLLRDADFGIHGFNIEEEEVPREEAERRLRDEAKPLLAEVGKTVTLFSTTFLHPAMARDAAIAFPLDEESRGTQRLFGLAGPFLDTLERGAVLFVDELEASLHPLLSRKLVELFQRPELNRRNAQLVFATHDVTLLDPGLLRRDQIWMTEKDSQGATHLYPLLEYKPRKGEALQKGYLAGRYGALPVFGDFDLNES